MNIRLFTPEDLPRCLSIFQSNCPDYFTPAEKSEFTSFLQANEFPYWLMETDKADIGCGGIYTANNKSNNALFTNEVGFAWGMIHQDYHQQGFGKKLSLFRLQYLQKHFPNRPIVLRTTQLTAGFFKQLGFVTHQTVKNGYGDGLDKHVMVYKNK